jgi:transposase-like protein
MFSLKPYSSIIELIKAFPDEQSCIDHLEWLRWEGKIVSPFDETSQVYKCTNNRYKCKNTNKYFNVRTGTIFEGTKIGLQHWFLAIFLFTSHNKGISSYQLAKDLSITQKSAWFMLSRIRYAMEHEIFMKEMEGVVEIDETFVGGKNKNRHHDKKVKGSQGRSFKDKTPVMGMLADGKVRCVVIGNTRNESIHPEVYRAIKQGSIIVTDEWQGYDGLENDYHREVVDHGRGRYVNTSGFTTNRIEGFWSQFKKVVIGTYHNRISRNHLKLYADEISYRFNTREYSSDTRMNVLLQGTAGKRLTYNELTR